MRSDRLPPGLRVRLPDGNVATVVTCTADAVLVTVDGGAPGQIVDVPIPPHLRQQPRVADNLTTAPGRVA